MIPSLTKAKFLLSLAGANFFSSNILFTLERETAMSICKMRESISNIPDSAQALMLP